MQISTFEDLPDEILMLIVRYSGEILNILRAFLGLNHRLNSILVDRRLDLLTNYVPLESFYVPYESDCFQQIQRQIFSIKTDVTEAQLRDLLQPLISYAFQQKYRQIRDEFQSEREKFLSIRQELSSVQRSQFDHEIFNCFWQIEKTPVTIEHAQRIKELIFSKGACLECENNELAGFNLGQVVPDWILRYINSNIIQPKESTDLYAEILRAALISNPNLLDNRGYVGNGGLRVDRFFLYTFFNLRDYYHINSFTGVRLDCFRTITNLLLLVLCCRSETGENRAGFQRELLFVFSTSSRISNPNDSYIRTCQSEVAKLIFEQCQVDIFESTQDSEYYALHTLKNLIKYNRLDIMKYLIHLPIFGSIFVKQNCIRECLNMMTSNSANRQIFQPLINDSVLKFVFPRKDLLFILLKKRERQLLENLLQVFPDLIHELDDQGNDPLMYIALNVFGCRHRIIEMLLRKGCENKQRQNSNGQTFQDILQLPKNRKLLNDLIEYEII